MTKVISGYRFVAEDLRSEHGDCTWKVGEWKKLDNNKPLALCANGFHASQEPLDSLSYIFGTRWFKCEARGKILHDTDKFCASEMRLTKEIQIAVIQKFAVKCAEHVLPLFEKQFPEDKRPREAIEAAKAYLDKPTDKNLRILNEKVDAAWTARDAARAARDAAWAARAARDAAWTARDAAWAARDAAWTARDARDAAWAAARDKEHEWQQKTLNKLLEEASQQ